MDLDEDFSKVDCDSSMPQEGGNGKLILGTKDGRKVLLPVWV